VAFVTSAAAQTPPETLDHDVLWRAQSVVSLHSAGAWPWPVQEAAPGWLEGRAAAEKQDVSARRALGFVGGLAISIFGVEALSQDNEPVYFGQVALGGAALVALGILRVGSAQPSSSIMEEVSARGPDYASAFRDGYSSRLASRRTRAGLAGSGVGLGVGAALLMVVVAAWCGGGDC